MKILPIKLAKTFDLQANNTNDNKKTSMEYKNDLTLSSYPKNYFLLNFMGVRVDKDLASFYERNKDRMPSTFKNYVEGLSAQDLKTQTPMVAQSKAYEYLLLCDSVEDVKDIYCDEELFSDLKPASKSKAKRGLLYDIRVMRDIISDGDEQILKGGDDLTLYLVKKIFFEGKTISEINQDLDNDLNEVFKKEDKNYVSSQTLASLGIKLPNNDFLTSLRYTKDGYSDRIGQKISEAYSKMSQEKKEEIKNSRTKNPNRKYTPHSMSQEAKDNLSKINKKRWEKLTPQEKTEIIDRLQQGSEKQRNIMICAWNKIPQVRKDLSLFLLQNNFYSPESIIYRNSNLSASMKVVMSAFWEKYPQYADELGKAIEDSTQEYEQAQSGSTLDEFILKIKQEQQKAKQEIKELNKVQKATKAKMPVIEQYKTMFSFLPKSLLDFQLKNLEKLDENEIKLWIRYCRGDKLSQKETQKAQAIEEKVFPRRSREAQTYILAVINNLEDCFAPIENPITHKLFKPTFPLNLEFKFSDITTFYFLSKKSGYKNVNLDFSLFDEDYTKKILNKNPKIRFNQELIENYAYNFAQEPDFDKIAQDYELAINQHYHPAFFEYKMKLNSSKFDTEAQKESLFVSLDFQSSAFGYPLSQNKEYGGALFRISRILEPFKLLDDNQWYKNMYSAYEKDFIEVLSLSKDELYEEKQKLLETFKTEFDFLPEDMINFQSEKLKRMSNDEIELWISYLKGEAGEAIKNPKLERIAGELLNRYKMENYINALAIELFDCLTPFVNFKTGAKAKLPASLCFDFEKDLGELTGVLYKLKNNTYQDKDFPKNKEGLAAFEEYVKRHYSANIAFIRNYQFKLDKKPDTNKINLNYKIFSETEVPKEVKEKAIKILLGDDYSDVGMYSCLANNITDADLMVMSRNPESMLPSILATILARMNTEFVKKGDFKRSKKLETSNMVLIAKRADKKFADRLFVF